MRRSAPLTVAVVGATVLTTVWSGSAASGAARPHFHRVSVAGVANGFRPLALSPARSVTVSVVMTTPSVAARELTAGRHLTSAERAAAHRQISDSHAGVRSSVAAHGGRVIRELADAVDAVTVRVPESALPALAAVPGVARVVPSRIVHLSNTTSELYTGVGQAWQATGRTGTGVKVAVIDTGIDYYHSDFGGAGNPADFANDSGLVVEPGTFPTAKVIGGFDFVGDNYDSASADPAKNTPKPDPDPLDCNGHGSHTAGTAAGFGVTASGATYHGPYTEAALRTGNLRIGPGTAPNALIMAYRVFGCDGSATDADVAGAIDRAVADGADVINMSLGETFGGTNGLDTIAADAAALAGVVVVASAGNEGPSAYMTGSPGTSTRTISVAALDTSLPAYPAASIDSSPAATTGLVANGIAISPAITAPVFVVSDGAGGIGLGCASTDYTSAAAGAIVVTKRGTCARVDRATLGQAAGALAVIMVNNGGGLPPFEGPIPGVTIPFIGMPLSAEATLAAMTGTHTITAAGTIPNPTYGFSADFSSAGPRNDSILKPDIAAPGVSVISVGAGTGSGPATISGTSMASPHTAGIAALVVQAHPSWPVVAIKAALTNTATADPTLVHAYDPTRLGAGLVQPRKAVDTSVLAETADGLDNLSFGYQPRSDGFSQARTVTLDNRGGRARTYRLAAAYTSSTLGSTIQVSPSTVTVRAHSRASVRVTIRLSAAAVAALPAAEASDGGALASARGVVTATPTSTGAGIYPLRVPFLLVPRGLSQVQSQTPVELRRGSGVLTVHNEGNHAGNADVYALGVTDPQDAPGPTDLRAVGVQAQPGDFLGMGPDDRSLLFAVNTFERWGNPGESEFDVVIDTNGDGQADYVVVGVDDGLVFTGTPNGFFDSLIFDAAGNIVDGWGTVAPMNSSTVLLPAAASDLGLTAGHAGFTYTVVAGSVVERGTPDDMTGTGSFDAFAPAQSTGDFVTLAPGVKANIPVTASGRAPAWLVVTFDDANGAAQADVVRAARAG